MDCVGGGVYARATNHPFAPSVFRDSPVTARGSTRPDATLPAARPDAGSLLCPPTKVILGAGVHSAVRFRCRQAAYGPFKASVAATDGNAITRSSGTGAVSFIRFFFYPTVNYARPRIIGPRHTPLAQAAITDFLRCCAAL